MVFRGWQKTSLIEYPGKIATVLFTGGCNFRCPFCYNAGLVREDSKLPRIGVDEVMDYLGAGLHQALVLSGGEPTLHPWVPDFFRSVKNRGLLTGLETNGSNPRMLKGLLEEQLVDFVSMDIKTVVHLEDYRSVVGLPDLSEECFQAIRESISLLMSSRVEYEFRTTVVPSLHDDKDIHDICRSIAGARRFVLQRFVSGNTLSPGLSTAIPPNPGSLRRLAESLRRFVDELVVR